MTELAVEIGEYLRQRGLTLGTVESATGGLIAHLLTNISGSSDYFKGSVVAYSNEVKIATVGVKAKAIEKYGAVSPLVARQMAQGGRRLLNVDICVADTGIAGPTGATPGKPLGLFYLGLAHPGGIYCRKHIFHGSREQNKMEAALTALAWIKEYLISL